MSYQQFKPHPALQHCIDAYWMVTSEHANGAVTSRILPDGCVDIICNLGSPVTSSNVIMAPDNVYLIGTMTSFEDSVSYADTLLIGIRFKPGGFGLFYDLPLHETADQCLEFDRTILDVADPADLVSNLNGYFLRKQQTTHTLLPVLSDIIRQKGTTRISAIAKKHFITERQLERNFKRYTGIGPKAFSNIIRFRSIVDQVKQNRNTTFETIAFENGYYDHAHLSNEIKRYTGYTPAQL